MSTRRHLRGWEGRAGPRAHLGAPPGLAHSTGGTEGPGAPGTLPDSPPARSPARGSPGKQMHTRTLGIGKAALSPHRRRLAFSAGKRRVGERCCTFVFPFGSNEAAEKEGSTTSIVKFTPKESGICRPSPARSLGAERLGGRRRARPQPRSAAPGRPRGGRRFPYLEVLEEGGDARDLQAEAPGGAAGALDAHSRQGLVQPPSSRCAGAAS